MYGKKSYGNSASGSKNKKTTSTTTESSNSIDDDPDLCTSGNIDTIFNGPNGYTYVFKGDRYWKLTDSGVARGYPKLIAKSWPGLPTGVDAAFTYKNNKTYFFKVR